MRIEGKALRRLSGDAITEVAEQLRAAGVDLTWRCVVTVGDHPSVELVPPDGGESVWITSLRSHEAHAFFVVWYVAKEGTGVVFKSKRKGKEMVICAG